MNLNYKDLLPRDFDGDSRVWIYQSNRLFGVAEALQVESLLREFVSGWQTHGIPVKGYGALFFGQFIILVADESATGVSGCSTDSSVRLIKQIEGQFKVSLFDRQLLAFLIKDKIQVLPLSQLSYGFENDFLTDETIYFDNTVPTLNDLESRWIQPISQTWLKKKIPGTASR